jgi:hypothetical protein
MTNFNVVLHGWLTCQPLRLPNLVAKASVILYTGDGFLQPDFFVQTGFEAELLQCRFLGPASHKLSHKAPEEETYRQ